MVLYVGVKYNTDEVGGHVLLWAAGNSREEDSNLRRLEIENNTRFGYGEWTWMRVPQDSIVERSA